MSKSRPVLITFSILAGLQILTAGSVLSDVIGPQIAGLIVLGIAAVQGGLSFYVQGQVVPQQDVAAFVNKDHEVVAGPAGGTQVGQKVVLGTNNAV